MQSLTAALPPGAVVSVDTVTFIYYVEAAPRYLEVVRPFFEVLAAGQFRAATSVITLTEIAVGPLQRGRPDVADDYELLIRSYPHLRVLDVDPAVARLAAELRARERLGLADSLQVAAALEADATVFVTNDLGLARLRTPRVVILDTLLG